ncbi:hypothetical protein [Brachyspira innocens]|uniref:hypothetical protein n=1 Tax=Brachyspira innocens TaxID=13264 RepID=UPI0026ED4DA7|nr:hypothetical protein [Brachyspira innocens]
MKNNIMYFIILLVISCLISIFVSHIFISNREKIEPISISINISDTNANLIEESFITKTIEENINKLYDRSISSLNTSIVLFSTCLGIFTVLFGVFYISKINEIQKEINNIKSLPEEVFKKFYKQKFKDDINNLLSDDVIKRNIAIKGLSNNTEITKDDFNLLEKVLYVEINSKNNVFYYTNIWIILSILVGLDLNRTLKLIIKILENTNEPFNKISNFIKFLFIDTDNIILDKYINKIFISNDNTILVNYILSYCYLYTQISKYFDVIIANSNENTIVSLLSQINLSITKNDAELFLNLLLKNRKNIENESSILSSILSNENIDNIQKVELVLMVYYKNNENENFLYNYLIKIITNTSYINEFKNIYDSKYRNKLSLESFFQKYSSLKIKM